MTSKASIAGHPIHPMLIPLPIGLWIFSLVGDIIWLMSGDVLWNGIALYSMLAGVMGALLAALPGFIDLYTMRPSRAKGLGIWHMGINLSIVVVYILNLAWRSGSGPGTGPFLLSCLAIALLLTSGWLGGEMVYVHGVAVTPPNNNQDRQAEVFVKNI